MLLSKNIALQVLHLEDAEGLYFLFKQAKIIASYDSPVIQADESEVDFTKRIIATCDYSWSIRLIETPDVLIGICALHHFDKENKQIEIGGTLLPDYWGQGIMQNAFQTIIQFASEELNIKQLIGKTKPTNFKAIHLVEKLGFKKASVSNKELILLKKLF